MGLKSVSLDPVAIYSAPKYGLKGHVFELVNLDGTNPVYYSNGLTFGDQSDVIMPMGSAGFDGSCDVWLSTLNDAITVLVQDGIPGQSRWNSGPVVQAMSISSQGIPPTVPNIDSVAEIEATPGGSPYSVFTFPSKGRMWGVDLSASVISNSPVSNARVFFLAQLDGSGIPGAGTPLANLELAAVTTIATDSGSKYVPFNGFTVAAGKQIFLIVNDGNTVTDAILTATAIFFYSIL